MTHKQMSPQEISDYKLKWGSGCEVQVDMDSDGWGKDFCRQNFNPQNWSFHKHTFPDDSHTFYFEEEKKDSFKPKIETFFKSSFTSGLSFFVFFFFF